MYPAPIEKYLAPSSVAEALAALADGGEDTHCIAGGQSLMQAIKSRLLQPKCLVDLQHVDELKGISANGGLRIGAMTRYRDIAAADRLHGAYQALNDAAAHVGDRQVRNRGTIGGSLCWNYIAACMPPTALALNAELELAGNHDSRRTLTAEDFIGAPLETARGEDELLLAVHLPAVQGRAGSAYKKWGLVTDSLPVIGVCAYVELDDNGACRTARVAVGGLASGPRRAGDAEAALQGVSAKGDGDDSAFATAAAAAADELETQGDHWADKDYRKQLIRTLGAEVIGTAFTRASAS